MTSQNDHKNIIRRLFGSKSFLFLVSFILIALTISLGRESYRKYQLNKEIESLRTDIEQLEGRNRQLANLMRYFEDESYLEKEARLKLNLKKPGEKVVILSSVSDGLEESEKKKSQEQVNENKDELIGKAEETANYWKWWEYFFAP
jgi:cell division protein FtsB